jgi:thioredoxin reductase
MLLRVQPRVQGLRMTYDVVVVGGGAAGLSAGVMLARARRRVVVLDDGTPRNAPAAGMHGFLGHDGIAPDELLARGRAELAHYGGELLQTRAVAARPGFEVDLCDGSVLRSRRLLVATGLTDVLPDVPGVRERWGRDVVHCPYCHGWEHRDARVAVLGASPMTVHAALLWTQWTRDVVLLQHTAPAPSDLQRRQLAARGVAVVEGRVERLEVVDDRVAGAVVDGRLVPCAVVVSAGSFAPRSELLTGFGLLPEPMLMGDVEVGTRIPTGPAGTTSVPGLYVAGNLGDPSAQVVAAAAQGGLAAGMINMDLLMEDVTAATA